MVAKRSGCGFFFWCKRNYRRREEASHVFVHDRTIYVQTGISPPPQKNQKEAIEQLLQALRDHFHQTPSVIVERFQFYSWVRKPGKLIAVFISQHHCLSQYCKFEVILENMRRDCLVCGINDKALQEVTRRARFDLCKCYWNSPEKWVGRPASEWYQERTRYKANQSYKAH